MVRRPVSPGARLARVALAAGAAAAVAAAVVVVVAPRGGSRPEEMVARRYLEAFFAADTDASYGLTTKSYRSLVFRPEHAALSTALHQVVGERVRIRVLGSERTPGSDPPESLVGYRASTAAGQLRGVVTLLRVDDDWRVAELSYNFLDPPSGATTELDTLTRRLNDQVAERARRVGSPSAAGQARPPPSRSWTLLSRSWAS